MKDRFDDDDFPRVSRPDCKGRRENKMRQVIKQVSTNSDEYSPELYEELEETFVKIKRTRR